MKYLTPPDFTIGADPEFSCAHPKNGKHIESGCHTQTSSGTFFGADGCGVIFEVRPLPSRNPLEVVGNIHNIFEGKILDKPSFLDYKWVSGSYYNGYCMGGHIHFGIKKRQIHPSDACPFLDNYVGAISLLLEGKSEGLHRRNVGYGSPGDYRTQTYGFEYRTPSSWLTSPYVASAMLCLAKSVMYEVLHNKKFRQDGIEKLPYKVTVETFRRMHVGDVKRYFPFLWKNITKMELYQMYKPYLDLIYFLVTNNLSWQPTGGMKEAWGLSNLTQFNRHQLSIGTIWSRYVA